MPAWPCPFATWCPYPHGQAALQHFQQLLMLGWVLDEQPPEARDRLDLGKPLLSMLRPRLDLLLQQTGTGSKSEITPPGGHLAILPKVQTA